MCQAFGAPSDHKKLLPGDELVTVGGFKPSDLLDRWNVLNGAQPPKPEVEEFYLSRMREIAAKFINLGDPNEPTDELHAVFRRVGTRAAVIYGIVGTDHMVRRQA